MYAADGAGAVAEITEYYRPGTLAKFTVFLISALLSSKGFEMEITQSAAGSER